MRPEEKRNFGNIFPEVPAPRGGVGVADQAEGLRRLVGSRPKPARVLAITSGKGGVGKTNVAVNLAIALAQCRKRVVLVDLDLGLANADILLDMTPRYTLAHVISGLRTLDQVTAPAVGGIHVIPGASGVEKLANLGDAERGKLVAEFESLHLRADFILFDTGAGISRNTTAFLAAADDIIVVTVPEPPAIIDAYAMIKMLSREPDHGDLFVLMNQAASREEADRIAGGISTTATRLLGAYVEKLGYVVTDPRVGAAVRQRRPFLLAYPSSPASECLRSIARRIAFARSGEVPPSRPGFVSRLWSALTGR